jgi:hypothetical protein
MIGLNPRKQGQVPEEKADLDQQAGEKSSFRTVLARRFQSR